MTWEQVLFSGGMFAVGVLGLALTLRAIVRSSGEHVGAVSTTLQGHENRLCAVEAIVDGVGADRAAFAQLKGEVHVVQADMKDMAKGMTALQIQLAAIPEQLKRLEDRGQLQHEATTHSLRNLRTSVDGLARRSGVMPAAEA